MNAAKIATLIVGFSLSSLSADNLAQLGDDSSSFCIYKGRSMFLGFVFVLANSVSISLNITVVGISSYLIYRSQRAALDTNTSASTHKLRIISTRIYSMFVIALLSFFLSAIIIVWLFIGVPNWVIVDAPRDQVDNNTVILTSGNHTKVRCLDVYSDEDDKRQIDYGTLVAGTNTVVFGFSIVMGLAFAYHITRQFDDENLQKWYAEWEEQRKLKLKRRSDEQKFQAANMSNVENDNMELVLRGVGEV